jgi:tripartite-type tricarboxylate transporter receptor subunit TctC
MERKMFWRMALVMTLMVAFCLPATLFAMEKPKGFPKRPITMIVPYGAGGGSDQLSRAMATALETVVGVPIKVVNKPGGSGVAGLSDFFLARPDGYTVTEHIDDAASLYASGVIKQNPAEEWYPVCIAQIAFSQIYVRPKDERFPDWDAFVKYAKANPGTIKVANVSNVGSMERVVTALLEKDQGIKLTQVSFDKPAERYASLVGGHVDALFEQPGDVRPYMESGDMKPIITILNERPSAFSDVPCLKDVGAKFKPLFRFRGFFIRKEVPMDRQKYFEWAFKQAWNSESFQKFNKMKYMHLIDSYRGIEGGKELVSETVQTYREMGSGKK